jgi:hypothetical protein
MLPVAPLPPVIDPEVQRLVCLIGDQFAVQGEFVLGEEIDCGHINSAYRANYREKGGGERRYIFQSLNRNVF